MTLETLELVRATFGARPLVLVAAAAAFLLLARRLRFDSLAGVASRAVVTAGILGLAAYVPIAASYAASVHYFDNAEPTMTAVGWMFYTGAPIYHALDAPERYAHIYGPAAFMAHGFALAALGPAIAASKLLGVAAALLSLGLLVVALRTHASLARAAVLAGICALLLLHFRNYSFWTRPEPLQLLCVSAALLVVVRAPGLAAGAVLGILIGILWNLKITGPLYVLPLLALLRRRSGFGAVALAAITAAPVAALPFAVFPNVSLGHYIEWLRLSAETGLLLSTLRQNLEWAAYLSLPLLLSAYAGDPGRRSHDPELRAARVALGAAICGVVLFAAKPGAGPYHLIPILPIVFYIVSWQLENTTTVVAENRGAPLLTMAFVAVMCVAAVVQQAQFLATMAERGGRDEAADLAAVIRDFPGVVEMGYGSSEAMSFQRPLLVFRSSEYLLDQPAIREHQLAGLALPPATVDALRDCAVEYWLIPRGEEPFSGRNAYDAVLGEPLFPDAFRRVFREMHSVTATTRYFDVWKCGLSR